MIKFSVNSTGINPKLFREPATKAERWLANEVLKDTRPFVPALTESLSNRAHVENGNQVVYPGPYARYLYFGKVMEGPLYGPKHATDRDLVFTKSVHPQAQAFWFEASKAQNEKKWESGVRKIVGDEIGK